MTSYYLVVTFFLYTSVTSVYPDIIDTDSLEVSSKEECHVLGKRYEKEFQNMLLKVNWFCHEKK